LPNATKVEQVIEPIGGCGTGFSSQCVGSYCWPDVIARPDESLDHDASDGTILVKDVLEKIDLTVSDIREPILQSKTVRRGGNKAV
jgi:hypothetical protein